MYKAYRFRMYPSEDQQILIGKHIGSCRFVWNHFLDLRNKKYTETGESITRSEMSSLLPILKKENEWLNEVNSQSIQQVLMHLDSAFHGFFRNITSYPRFKKKRNSGSFSVPQHFSIDGNHLTLPKFKLPIRIFMHREIQGTMRSLTISKTNSGKYYVSILAETLKEMPESREIKPSTTVSMDVGITEFLTLSDGIQIGNPRNLKKSEKKLAKRQRQLSRKQKGSRNMNKARIKVSTLQEHIANQRMDFHNKISDILTRQYDTMITEDLNVSGMMKNHNLARSIADAGWSSFFTILKTKALSRGKNIIEIGTFDPSSRMCSHCGYIYDLKLSERTWTCPRCNTTHDREWNAAINVKRFGLIKTGIPTDSGELTPVDTITSTISLLEKEGIKQVKWLKQEAPRL
ncbi:MAG: RNA-guided endonuclease TnpB family protein [Thermoplasmataceae archaeon]